MLVQYGTLIRNLSWLNTFILLNKDSFINEMDVLNQEVCPLSHIKELSASAWEIQPLGEEQYKFTLSSSFTWQFITDIIYAYLHHEVTFHFGKESYSRICKILTRSAYKMRGQLNLYVAIDSWLLNSHPNDFK